MSVVQEDGVLQDATPPPFWHRTSKIISIPVGQLEPCKTRGRGEDSRLMRKQTKLLHLINELLQTHILYLHHVSGNNIKLYIYI